MINNIDVNRPSIQIICCEDKKLVLLDYDDPIFLCKEEAERNIFLLNSNGNVIWRVKNNISDGGFVMLTLENGLYYAIGWDTGKYLINIEDGHLTPIMLLK